MSTEKVLSSQGKGRRQEINRLCNVVNILLNPSYFKFCRLLFLQGTSCLIWLGGKWVSISKGHVLFGGDRWGESAEKNSHFVFPICVSLLLTLHCSETLWNLINLLMYFCLVRFDQITIDCFMQNKNAAPGTGELFGPWNTAF